MATSQGLLAIREPKLAEIRVLTTALAEAGISSALWGVCAAIHYGGGLCPLDIELVINSEDQECAYELLTSQGLIISTPNTDASPPTS
ncbi:hypothetical protein VMCG_10806 [Cytospora schulzeri]|uniref:DUF2007 domain-containing protein n=1 Tax=Cytospora schulzeri TaxID=448051 RepID=A0A423V7T8_9PEZI|nr:hypothetical protein VMCG_10806 [Valsa malicola]